MRAANFGVFYSRSRNVMAGASNVKFQLVYMRAAAGDYSYSIIMCKYIRDESDERRAAS